MRGASCSCTNRPAIGVSAQPRGAAAKKYLNKLRSTQHPDKDLARLIADTNQLVRLINVKSNEPYLAVGVLQLRAHKHAAWRVTAATPGSPPTSPVSQPLRPCIPAPILRRIVAPPHARRPYLRELSAAGTRATRQSMHARWANARGGVQPTVNKGRVLPWGAEELGHSAGQSKRAAATFLL